MRRFFVKLLLDRVLTPTSPYDDFFLAGPQRAAGGSQQLALAGRALKSAPR